MTALDMKMLNEDKAEADILAAAEADSSDEEWEEKVDREWKKEGSDLFDNTEAIEGLESVQWEYGADFEGPHDQFVHEDDTPHDDLRVLDDFKDLFKNPVHGNILSTLHANYL